jgi:hypothetical protein
MHLHPSLFRFKFGLWFVYVFFTVIITHFVAVKGFVIYGLDFLREHT